MRSRCCAKGRRNQGLELGAEANLPEWDGHVVDYDWAVGAMIGMG